jgi:hypothetical protein
MSLTERPTAAFVLSFVAGLIILLGGAMRLMFRFYWFRGMMRGFGARLTGIMAFPGYAMMWGRFSYMDGIVGLALGVLMIVGAVMLYNRPQRHATWGTVIVILSVLSLFARATGGLGIGLILGLVGGLLAITWKPTQTQPKT